MQAERIDHMFRFTFEKSSDELKEKAALKIKALRAKIEERQARVVRIKNEYGVTAEVLNDILMQMRVKPNAQTYSVSNAPQKVAGSNNKASQETVIPAGVINNILTEEDYISAETGQVDKLELIVRNLKDLKDENGQLRGHRISYEELTYLGF